MIKDNPKIDTALKKLEGKVSTKEMQKLNYEADGKGKEPAIIAEEYLKNITISKTIKIVRKVVNNHER